MHWLKTSFLSLLAYTTISSCSLSNIYSTSSAQVSMTLALSITTSAGSNKQAESSIDMDKQMVKFSLKIRDFKFDNSFVENAFEESYMEAGSYPEAVFQGKLKNPINLKSKSAQKIDIVGDLMMHGVKKTKTITAHITVISATQIKVVSDFVVKASDHKIDISASMFANGRDEIKSTLNAIYQKK